MPFLIEHALVMDTDHLPGGGGYAVTGMSPGVLEAERLFVSDNFGISDFLHDPENARVYFSVRPVPGGRTAFVRRFSNGTRRGGAQNRMFVHTLFLEDPLLEALHHLPWLLPDQPLRLGANDIYLTLDVAPLLEAGFPALEWSGRISDDEAFGELRLRYEQFGRRLAQSGEYAGQDGFDAVAAVLEAVRSGGWALLPQGMLFEQLSLLAWSMLPPPDRFLLPWTQHDCRVAASAYGIANAAWAEGSFVDLRTRASDVTRRMVTFNTRDAESWQDFHSTTARLGISLRSGDLEWWLRWRDSLEDLLANPLASDADLFPKLERVAKSVRSDRREVWVDEMEVLRFLMALVNRSIEAGQPHEIAVRRWSSLFQRTRIGEVIFRRPPTLSWLDESEKRIGAGLVAECFIAGSEQLPAAAGTRAALTEWLLLERRLENVPIAIVGRLIERLAGDQSALAHNMIEAVLRLPAALRELAAVLPARKLELGRTFVDIIASAVRIGHEDAGWFAEQMLLPQLAINPELAQQISRHEAETVGAALQARPQAYARFAAWMPPNVAAALVSQIETWLAAKPKAALPVARQILQLVNRREFPGRIVEQLAFKVAEAGERAELWLPAAIDAAKLLDAKGSAAERDAFISRVRQLAGHATRVEKDAVRQLAAALRQVAGERSRAGSCLRELIRFTRRSWSPAAAALSGAVEVAIAVGSARTDEWCDVVADLVAMQTRDGALSAVGASLLVAFWERLSPSELGAALPPSLIEAIAFLEGAAADRLLARWLLQLRRLPELPATERFLDLLSLIATDREHEELEVERAWREIGRGARDADILRRLERAQGVAKRPGCDSGAAIKSIVETMPRWADRAAWLVRIAAAADTRPVTRRVIEKRFLPVVLPRLGARDWRDFLDESGDDLFAHGNILLMIARELALSDAGPTLVDRLEHVCRTRGREDAIRAMAEPVPRGLAERVSVRWTGDFGS